MASRRFLAVMLGLGMLVGLSAAATPSADEIQQLVEQLGARKFAERDAAQKALDKIGGPALDALRKATTHEDPEVRRRAAELVQSIQARTLNEQILRPTLVKLSFKDTPVEQAVKELAVQSKLAVEILMSDLPKLKDRKVTLETGEVSFWEGLDRLCVAAGLSHQGVMQQPIPIDNVRINRRLPPQPVGQPGPTSNPNAIVLRDGKPALAPTVYAGAARVRLVESAAAQQGLPNDPAVRPPLRPVPIEVPQAVPPGPAAVPQAGPVKSIGLMLEVAVEPRIQLRGQMTVRLEKAIDDKDQALTRVALADEADAGEDGVIVLNNAQGVVVIKQAVVNNNKLVVRPSYQPHSGGLQMLPLHLKLPENAGKHIRTLKGVIEAPIALASSITIDDVMKAETKTYKNADGLEFKLNGVKVQPSGIVEIDVEVDYTKNPLGMNGGWGPNAAGVVGQVQGVAQVQIQVNGQRVQIQPAAPAIAPEFDANGVSVSNAGFTLKDDKGAAYYPAGVQSTAVGRGPVSLKLLFKHPQGNNAATPKALTFSSPRMASVDIPFEFKDVPLK